MQQVPSHPMELSESTPLYVQVRESLRARIERGDFFPSTRIPSEAELIAAYGVSRVTVRQALRDLEGASLLHRVHGKGTFAGQPKATQNASEIRGFGAVMAEQGHKTTNVVRVSRSAAATERVARHLGLAIGDQIWELQRLRLLDGVPISFDHTFLPLDIGTRLAAFDLESRDVFEIFESDLGIRLAQAQLEIEAIPATRELAADLGIKRGEPVLKVQRLTSSAIGRAVDFEDLYYRADRFRYQVHINRHLPT